MKFRALGYAALLAALPLATGCTADTGQNADDITDVKHTDVERQSIGNCWLYAQATWVESMNYSATDEPFDVSQSYWTYWHWYGEITGWMWGDEISTGGNQWTSNDLVLERGIMAEADFVPEDGNGEMSYRQDTALDKMNAELKDGRLSTREARRDKKLVRQVLDEAWGLSDEVREQLDTAFGEDGSRTLRGGGSTEGTRIIAATDFPVRYTELVDGEGVVKDTTVDVAIREWDTASYPSSSWMDDEELAKARREVQIRIQRALHDAQPVVTTWNVDFNAMENRGNELQGSFNLETLEWNGGPGHQGGHMTVLEDYQAVTEDFGLLKAGETLDPEDPEDAAKLDALLEDGTVLQFLRIKNSWGSLRPDREFAPGFPGYHDLYFDYLNGPIEWCPSVDDKTEENCTGTTVPFRDVMLPPGY
jgi:hypothetical protein